MSKKVPLKNEAHIFQMLGVFDKGNNYKLPKDLAEILLKMPKHPIVSNDEIDVGTNTAFLQSTFTIDGNPIKFCLENNNLYLVEQASEMGNLITYTYLVPLAELTLDYFKNIDANVDLEPLKKRIRQRREKHYLILAEHERLARSAMRQAKKILDAQPLSEYSKHLEYGKRFIRLGKPDYNSSQLQLLSHIINKNNLTHPVSGIINRWETLCGNETTAELLAEQIPTRLHEPQINDTKKPRHKKNQSFNFSILISAMTTQNKPKKHPARLMPSDKVAEVLNAEHEIEYDFEPEDTQLTTEQIPTYTADEKKLQQLVSQLLQKQPIKSITSKVVTPRVSLKGKRQDQLSQHAPEPLNPEREQ